MAFVRDYENEGKQLDALDAKLKIIAIGECAGVKKLILRLDNDRARQVVLAMSLKDAREMKRFIDESLVHYPDLFAGLDEEKAQS